MSFPIFGVPAPDSLIAMHVAGFVLAWTSRCFWKPPSSVASPTYWLMMQVGMIAGLFTTWPVNARLVRRGWKEEM